MLNKFGQLMKLCDEADNEDWDVRQDAAEEFTNMWQLVEGERKSAKMSKLRRVGDVADEENIFAPTCPHPRMEKHTARTVAQRSPTHRVQHQGTDILSVDDSRDNPDETPTLTLDSGAA